MKQTVKCCFCKQDIDKDSAYCDSSGKRNRYYCDENHFKAQENKVKYKATRFKSNGEPNERRELTDWVQNYYISQGYDKHNINWTLETATLKNMMDNHNFKYTGILLTLKYMVDILNLNLLTENNHSIFALVPFYYDDCKRDYIETMRICKEIDEFDFNDEKIIKIKGYERNKEIYKEIEMEDLV